jgi:chemotaxis protein CheX
MSTPLSEQVTEAAMLVWSTVIGLPLEPTGHPLADRPDVLTGTVHITGEYDGAVHVRVTSALAATVAGRMFSLPATEIDEELTRDALAELTNMVGGQIKSLVAGPSKLSLPQVVAGERYSVRCVGARSTCEVTLSCGGQLLQVTVLEREIPQT